MEQVEDIDYTTQHDVISVRWGGFEDGDSGIMHYKFGYGTEPGLADIWPFEHVSGNTCERPQFFFLNICELYADLWMVKNSDFLMVHIVQ